MRIAQGAIGEGIARVREAVGIVPRFGEAWNTLGLGLKAQGALTEAIATLVRAAELMPGDPYVLSNLGGALWDAGRLAEAEAVLRQATSIAPALLPAQLARGRIALALGRADMAAECFRAALADGGAEAQGGLGAALLLAGDAAGALGQLHAAAAAAPDNAAIATDLARALAATGAPAAAEARLRALLARAPAERQARLQLGLLLQQRDDRVGAVACLTDLCAEAPDFAPGWLALAVNQGGLGRWADALASFDEAARRMPANPAAHLGRASALQMQERYAEAAEACRAALALAPDLPEAHASLGVVLQELGELDEAVQCHRRVLALRPQLAGQRCSLSQALRDLGRLDEATGEARIAVAQLPQLGFAHASLGFALLAQGAVDEAEACLRRALSLPPEGLDQVCGNGMIALLLGDYAAGLPGFEARWRRPRMARNPILAAGPAWTGTGEIAGRRLLLHAEQGLGDTLQCLRFVPAVVARGAEVLLAVPGKVAPLLPPIAGVSLVPPGQAVPPFDLHCALGSLPAALGLSLADLPGCAMPYLRAPAERRAAWAARLAPAAGGSAAIAGGLFARPMAAPVLRVGLAWSGNPAHRNDRNRSLPLARLAPLLAVAGCQFHMVQTELDDRDVAALAAAGPRLIDQRAGLADLADTAALMDGLDLVISVDSAPAHLAGALGRPLWLLLPAVPDWRWLLRREDSPWYPTARLFRQRVAGDWDEVIGRVAAELARLARR